MSRHVVAQLDLRRNAVELKKEIVARALVESQLREQNEQLAQSKIEQNGFLELAEKSRGALLSVLEDELLAGKKLRESDERFRQLADNINEVFWIVNPADMQILYVSPAFEKIWGRACESLYTSRETWLDSIHPDDRGTCPAGGNKQTSSWGV